MEQYKDIIEFAPVIVVVLLFMWQNNVFIKPEVLEKKHREILDEIEKRFKDRYVEVNAYKEFQNHIYSELEKVTTGIEELKEFIMKGGNK